MSLINQGNQSQKGGSQAIHIQRSDKTQQRMGRVAHEKATIIALGGACNHVYEERNDMGLW